MGRILAGVAALCLSLAPPLPGTAQTSSPDSLDIPLVISADEVRHDREKKIITAKGNVEIVRGDRILLSDSVRFDQRKNVLTATDNVTLVEPTGEVLFADRIELSGDFRDGIIENLRIILSDGARFAANGARRSGGDIIEMSKGVYSACKLSPGDLDSPPLWQVKAMKLVHDKKNKTIEYTDAWLELGGIPVAYTPYLSHPDPTVKRRTGLLVPSVGGSSDLGLVVRLPYFINIKPNMDATLTPIYTDNEGPVLAAEYRHVLVNGSLQMEGSVTEDSADDVRGHVRGKFRYDVDDTWRVGIDLDRASDDTYLRRYGFASTDTLTTRVFAQGFRKRNYMAVTGYLFQGLREADDFGTTPIVAPMFDYNHVGETDRLGGRSSLDVNLMTLTRTGGTDSRRLSLKAGWRVPYTGPLGDVYALSTSLTGDLYHVNDVFRSPVEGKFNGVTGRVVPQLVLDWRYPFVRDEGGAVYQVIEPVGMIVVSPYGGNPNKIPNEDSLDFEFDDTNLFSTNRFTGLDRIEGGPRFNYGLKWGVFGRKSGGTTIFFGQSYRPKTDDTFAEGSGLEDHFSDFVARVRVAPGENLHLLYRARYDKDDLAARRNEVQFAAGTAALNLSVNYAFFARQEDSEFPSREEVSAGLNTQWTRFWRSSLSAVRDLTDDGGMRSAALALTYEDCCFIFATNFRRSFFQDRDVKPTDSVTVRLTFKTLADVQTQVR